MRKMVEKVDNAASVMMSAFGSDVVLTTLEDLAGATGEAELRDQATIDPNTVADALVAMFGDIPIRSIWTKNLFCTYMDFDMAHELEKTIYRLRRDVDNRVETAYTLRDIGAYFAFLARSMNGKFGHKQALRFLTCSITIYELLHRLLPYVFDDDIEFIPGKRLASN